MPQDIILTGVRWYVAYPLSTRHVEELMRERGVQVDHATIMTPPHQEPTPGTREHFLQVTTLRRWGTIQEYVELCRAQGYFTPAFYATAVAHMERIHVRRRLKQVTNAQGWPVFGNIERVGPDGTPARVFLQEELFGPEEYRQIVAYHYGMAQHHLLKAQTYRDHAKARYGLQLPLFGEYDGDVGGDGDHPLSPLPPRVSPPYPRTSLLGPDARAIAVRFIGDQFSPAVRLRRGMSHHGVCDQATHLQGLPRDPVSLYAYLWPRDSFALTGPYSGGYAKNLKQHFRFVSTPSFDSIDAIVWEESAPHRWSLWGCRLQLEGGVVRRDNASTIWARGTGMAVTTLNFSWVIDGQLAGCARPFSERDLAFLMSQGIRAVVRLTTPEEGALNADEVTAAGLEDWHEPVRVLTAPSHEQIEQILRFIDRCVDHGKPVAVSCGAGYGRTGTILSCYFIHRGWSAAEAIAEVTKRGRHPYEVPEQLNAMQAYERRDKGT